MQHAKNWKPRPVLLDPEGILVNEGEKYITLSQVKEHKTTAKLLQEQDSKRRREFWLFLEEDDSKLKAQMQLLAASKDWEIIPTY